MFPKFSGKAEEWATWHFKVKALLAYKYPSLLDPAPGADATAPVRRTYQEGSKWLYLQLAVNLEGTAVDIVQACPEGNGALGLADLRAKYEEKTIARQCTLQAKVIQARLDDYEDPTAFFLKLEDDTRRLRTQGVNLPEEFLRNLILYNLPPTYHLAKTNLLMTDELTWNALKDRGVAFYSSALAPKTSSSSRPGGVSALTAEQRSRITCAYCHKPGHHVRDCRSKPDQNKIKCWRCGQRGHMQAQCSQPQSTNLAIERVVPL